MTNKPKDNSDQEHRYSEYKKRLKDYDFSNIDGAKKLLAFNLNENEQSDFEFCTYYLYWIEGFLSDILVRNTERFLHGSSDSQEISRITKALVERMTFVEKTRAFKDLFPKEYSAVSDKFLNEINTLRNKVAHGDVKNLQFREKLVSDISNRYKMVELLLDTFSESSKKFIKNRKEEATLKLKQAQYLLNSISEKYPKQQGQLKEIISFLEKYIEL